MQRTPLLSSRTPHVSCIHVSNELSLTITSSTMWKNFHLSFPGTSFSSLTGETCMIQPSTCLSFRAAVRKQKAHNWYTRFQFWWTCLSLSSHSRVNIPKALDSLHRNSGAVSNTKLWRAHLYWQFKWLLFDFVTTDYTLIIWLPLTLRNSPKGLINYVLFISDVSYALKG